MKADQSLDCMGLYCPMPIVKTVEKIKQLKQGEVLEVVADDKGIKHDMGVEEKGGEIRVYVKKSHE